MRIKLYSRPGLFAARITNHSSLITYLYDQLARIRAFEQFVYGLRGVFQSFDFVDAVPELTLPEPLAHVGEGFHRARVVVHHDEALHARALADQGGEVVRARLRLSGVVLRDHAAEHNAGAQIDQRQHLVEDLAADVLEIDVDALRAMPLQAFAHVLGLVVDGRVEAQFLRQPFALVVGAGDADNVKPFDLADLPDQGSRRARCRR